MMKAVIGYCLYPSYSILSITVPDRYTRATPKSTSNWLVKKIQNREQNFINLYGTVSYITALFLHIVANHI
jgi:hypothetical protein